MSLPARDLDPWRPPTSPRRAAPPARMPATRPPSLTPPHPQRRARRGPHVRFWISSLVAVSALTVALVSVNAMRVDAAYEAHVVREELASMSSRHEALVNDVARLSSPSRVGRWARANGLAHPEASDVVILQAVGTAR
jgi:cell division protein FtsL